MESRQVQSPLGGGAAAQPWMWKSGARAGVAEMIPGTVRGAFPDSARPMRPCPARQPVREPGWLHEPDRGGLRVLAPVAGARVGLRTADRRAAEEGLFRMFRGRGFRGVFARRRDSAYESGRRSPTWLRISLEA